MVRTENTGSEEAKEERGKWGGHIERRNGRNGKMKIYGMINGREETEKDGEVKKTEEGRKRWILA